MLRFLRTLDLALGAILFGMLAFILSGKFHNAVPCSGGMEGPRFIPWMSSKAAVVLFLPVLVFLPPAVLLIERWARRDLSRVIIAVALSQVLLLPSFPVWILTNDMLRRKAILNGLVFEIPLSLRRLLPLASFGAAALAIALLHRKSKPRLAVIAVAATSFALVIASNGRMLCNGFADLELGALIDRAPLVMGLILVRVTLSLLGRATPPSIARRLVSLAGLLLILYLVMFPLAIKKNWRSTELQSFWGARVADSGDLTVFARPIAWKFGYWGDLCLVKGKDQSLQRFWPRPVVPFGLGKGGEILSPRQSSGSLVFTSLSPLFNMITGFHSPEVIVSTSSRRLEFASHVGHSLQLPLAGGPGRSWIAEDVNAGRLFGRTIAGRAFAIDVSCSRFVGEVVATRFVAFSNFRPGTPVREQPCLVNVDLGLGTHTGLDLSPQTSIHSLQISPDGKSAIVGMPTQRPGPDFLVKFDCGPSISALDSPAMSGAAFHWDANGNPAVIDSENVPQWNWRTQSREFGGKVFLWDTTHPGVGWWINLSSPYRRDSYRSRIEMMDLKTGGWRRISTEAHDIEWLRDSIVFTEVTDKNERVIRYWPADERRETLFEIEIPPYQEPEPGT